MRTRSVTVAQARSYLSKAEEYLAASENEFEAERRIAATSPAINAADAVCGVRLGRRAAGTDHDQVIALLRQAGTDGSEVAKDLRRLLPLKQGRSMTLTTSRSLQHPKPSNAPGDVSPSPGAL